MSTWCCTCFTRSFTGPSELGGFKNTEEGRKRGGVGMKKEEEYREGEWMDDMTMRQRATIAMKRSLTKAVSV
jgi:hypothetical protein